jgi:hypothetical protein
MILLHSIKVITNVPSKYPKDKATITTNIFASISLLLRKKFLKFIPEIANVEIKTLTI